MAISIPTRPRSRSATRRPGRSREIATATVRTRLGTIETIAIFWLAFVVYTALGLYVTVHLQATPFDATSRLAHAFFAIHDHPGKLAAIGFVWPPIATLVLLPMAVLSPMATSLWALPVTSAIFAGGLLVVLNRTYILFGLPGWARWVLLAALGFNPYFARYASNGMDEMVSLFFVVLGVHYFVKWGYQERDHLLAACGTAWVFAALTRYEIAVYCIVVAIMAFFWMRWRRFRAERIEGGMLLLVAPVVYWFGLWLFFNALIMGDPLAFLHEQIKERFVDYAKEPAHGLWEPTHLVLTMNLRLFLPTFFVAVALFAFAWAKRSLPTLFMGLLLMVNPVVTLASMIKAQELSLVQARFNVRSLPLAMIGVGWLWVMAGPRKAARSAVIAAAVLLTVAGYPLTWNLMAHFHYQDQQDEARFTKALSTGKNQGTPDLAISASRRIGAWVNTHSTRRHRVLVDDAQAFGPMLLGGHPELYFDRIYKGDGPWKKVVAAPRGKVSYMIFTAAKEDLLSAAYRNPGSIPWLHYVLRDGKFTVYSVDPPNPAP